jgi:hypothetical protein
LHTHEPSGGLLGNKKELQRELKILTIKYDEYDRLATEARVKEMSLYQRLIEDIELRDALIMNSPIWEKLFPQEKHKALKLILKEVEYDAKDGKIGLTLNHNGIKFLYLLATSKTSKGLETLRRGQSVIKGLAQGFILSEVEG